MAKQTGAPRNVPCPTCRERKIRCVQDTGLASCRYCTERGFFCSGPQRTDRWLEKQQKKTMYTNSSKRAVQRSNIPDVPSGQKQTVPAAVPTLNPADVSLKRTARSTNVPASVQGPVNYEYHQDGAPSSYAYPCGVTDTLGDQMYHIGDPLLVNNNDGLRMPPCSYIQPEMILASAANQNVSRGTSSLWSHGTIQSAYANQNANFETFPYRPMDLPASNPNVQMSNTPYGFLDPTEYEELLRSFKNL